MDNRDQIIAYRANMPENRREAYDRVMSGKSVTEAILLKCEDCCNWDMLEVNDCLIPACPLFPYRAWAKSGG